MSYQRREGLDHRYSQTPRHAQTTGGRHRSRSPRRPPQASRRERSPIPRPHISSPSSPSHPLSPEGQCSVVSGITLRTAITERYGILPIPRGYTTPSKVASLHCEDEKLLMIMNHVNETIPKDYKVALKDLICCLAFKEETDMSQPSVPPCLSDMIRGTPCGYPIDQTNRWMMLRSSVDPEGTTWYFITSSSPSDVSWGVAVKDPLTANQVLRANYGPSVHDVAKRLLQWGIPFRTLIPHPLPWDELRPQGPVPMFYRDIPLGLGIKASGSPFTLEDYHKYVEKRDAFIMSHRGRAALMRGGIVWRLAMECRGFDDVLRGPSGYHTREDYIALEGLGFVDDQMNDQDLAVVCGTYRVVSDGEAYARASHESWWPSEPTWQESGHSVGYWTHNCEFWFQRHREKILAGKEQPRSGTFWTRALRHQKSRTKNMMLNARDLAARSLPYRGTA